jgi:hypothetical protein
MRRAQEAGIRNTEDFVEVYQGGPLIKSKLGNRRKTALFGNKTQGTSLEHPLGKNLVLVDSKGF